MSKQDQLADWIVEALEVLNGRASVVDVAKKIWERHSGDLKSSGDLFFTWQYDMRWSATRLRCKGILKDYRVSGTSNWELK